MLMCCLSVYFVFMFVIHVFGNLLSCCPIQIFVCFLVFFVFTILFSPSNYRFSSETPHSWRCCFCRLCQQQPRYMPHINDVSCVFIFAFKSLRLLRLFFISPSSNYEHATAGRVFWDGCVRCGVLSAGANVVVFIFCWFLFHPLCVVFWHAPRFVVGPHTLPVCQHAALENAFPLSITSQSAFLLHLMAEGGEVLCVATNKEATKEFIMRWFIILIAISIARQTPHSMYTHTYILIHWVGGLLPLPHCSYCYVVSQAASSQRSTVVKYRNEVCALSWWWLCPSCGRSWRLANRLSVGLNSSLLVENGRNKRATIQRILRWRTNTSCFNRASVPFTVLQDDAGNSWSSWTRLQYPYAFCLYDALGCSSKATGRADCCSVCTI